MSTLSYSRRKFLKISGLSSIAATLAACAPSTPIVIKETSAPEIVKETVIVPGEETTKEVIKEVQVTSVPPLPSKEAPMLSELVAAGKLPSLEGRLPANPLVIPELSEAGEYGGVLRQYAPNTTTFHDLHWVRESNWCRLAADTYFDTKGQNGVVMHRAESITANDAGTEYVVTLRKGMKWSDGEPVTADDIIFAVNDVMYNEELNVWWAGQWQDNHPEVTKVDDFSVKFTFKTMVTDFFTANSAWYSNQGLGAGETPSHYLKQFHKKYNEKADEEAKAAGYDNWEKRFLAIAACGTGQINVDLPSINAWILKTHTDTQNIYVRNPYYWAVDSQGNQLPYIDGFVIEAVSDIEVAKLKLIAGDFDLAGVFLIQLNEYPLLKKNEQNGKYLIVLNKGNVTAKPFIGPNLNHKDPVLRQLLQNPDFIKALSYAINREEINEIVFAGLGVGMNDIYTVFDHVDPKEWNTLYCEYDPDKAKQLLDGIGLKKDANGMYLRPDGKPLTFDLQTIVEEGWADSVELVAKHWTDIGIKSQYSPTARDLWGERNNANELDFLIWHDYSYSEEIFHGTSGQWSLAEKARLWDNWLNNKGQFPEMEEEPPAEWKQYNDDVNAMINAAYGSDEYKELAKKVWDFRIKDHMYGIGTIGDYPTPLLIKWDIGNFGNNDVPFNYWQGQYPEQWYWKDKSRSAERVP